MFSFNTFLEEHLSSDSIRDGTERAARPRRMKCKCKCQNVNEIVKKKKLGEWKRGGEPPNVGSSFPLKSPDSPV
ncbi:hypothetical protein EYF80_033015 [Liparis tanakae]|uniref:Uncharacterized protein n=1 Tax=Liparis tanakae TaxID=230148 RepID=A0A4Z2GT23_9TELE|nr:hypothetical protein EYF80_033015 [Liparis tanakae]